MKLNKVLALALSGVMAVSMLAGCSENGGASSEPTEPTGTDNAATVLNDAWDEDEKVIVNFTYSNSVETALERIVEVNGDTYTANKTWAVNAEQDLARVLGVDHITWNEFNGYDDNADITDKAFDTDEDVMVSVYRTSGVTADKAMEDAAEAYFNSVKGHFDDECEYQNVKYTFSYSGEAAMVSVEENGVVVHYIAYVMTSNTTKALA